MATPRWAPRPHPQRPSGLAAELRGGLAYRERAQRLAWRFLSLPPRLRTSSPRLRASIILACACLLRVSPPCPFAPRLLVVVIVVAVVIITTTKSYVFLARWLRDFSSCFLRGIIAHRLFLWLLVVGRARDLIFPTTTRERFLVRWRPLHARHGREMQEGARCIASIDGGRGSGGV